MSDPPPTTGDSICVCAKWHGWKPIALAEAIRLHAAGNSLQVWQDYVAGTDPTDENDLFRATIDMSGGTPVVSWTPVPSGWESNYNFFKVRVQMK